MRKDHRSKSEKGQAWVIMAISVTVLIILMGFAIDSAILFSNYTKLKRAVDAAAVAAANQYKVKNGKLTDTSAFDLSLLRDKMTESANEMLVMHDFDPTTIDLHLYLCGDPDLDTLVPDFYAKCPESQSPPALQESWFISRQMKMLRPIFYISLESIRSRSPPIPYPRPLPSTWCLSSTPPNPWVLIRGYDGIFRSG